MNYGRMCDGTEVSTIYEELMSRLPGCGFYIPNRDPSKLRLTHGSRNTLINFDAFNLDGNFFVMVYVSLHPANQAHQEDQYNDSISITFTFGDGIKELPPDAAKLINGLGLVTEKERIAQAA